MRFISIQLRLVGMNTSEGNPTVDIQKLLPEALSCSICQQNYDKGDHQPMLICFFQHCICLTCVQSLFEYGSEEEDVLCPFCKEPVIEESVDKFRLVEQLVDSYAGLKKYNNEMKVYINELVQDKQFLRDELFKEQTFNECNTKLIKKLYVRFLDNGGGPFQVSRGCMTEQKGFDKSKIIESCFRSGIKSSTNTDRNKSLKSSYSRQHSRKNITSVYYVKPKKNTMNKSLTYTNFLQNEEQDPEELSLMPKNLAKSILVCPKKKKPLPFVIGDQTKINNQQLKHIIKLSETKNKQAKDYRHFLAKVLISYNFLALRELDLSKGNLIIQHLQTLPTTEKLFPNIIELNLSHNRFTDIPNAVYGFTSLKKLNFSNNLLSNITVHISELINLVELDLWNNNLTDVPFILFNLKKLKKVDLSNNKIMRIQSLLLENGRIKFDFFGNPAQRFASKSKPKSKHKFNRKMMTQSYISVQSKGKR